MLIIFFFFLFPFFWAFFIYIFFSWCAGHRSWHGVGQASISCELASCPSCLGVRRIRAQQSSCLPWTRGISFSSASIPLPFVSWPSVWVLRLCNLLIAFILQPSVREFHQRALFTASPCGLQYESSISTPFSLPYLAAFNMGVPSVRPSHCFTLRPLIWEFHQHALLTASPCSLQRTLGTPTPFLAVAYGHDSCIFQA